MHSTTFIDNMSLPIHRWYRFTAGFSAEWVKVLVKEKLVSKSDINVLDPFSGSGTTLLSCDSSGVKSFGYEAQPMIAQIAASKLLWATDIEKFKTLAKAILDQAKIDESQVDSYPPIIGKCYDTLHLTELDRLKRALFRHQSDSAEYHLCWMAFVCIIRKTSHAGTASWQYVLPNNKKAKVAIPFETFQKQVDLMCEDMLKWQQDPVAQPKSRLLFHDARKPSSIPDSSIDLVITSPPYANNYDYADSTRLESCLLGSISSWGDLAETRDELVRSCSQAVSKHVKKTYEYLEDPLLAPIHDEIIEVCKAMEAERENHGGKKNYHTMIALYFLDMAKVWVELRRVCKPGADVCFVVGDSAPYGVYVPVDDWLGRLALNAGFVSYSFEKTRDRNIKWKNRKHRVPLKEGRLWIRG